MKPRGRSLTDFGAIPNFAGTRGEVLQWARDKSVEWDLPVVEVEAVNVDFGGRLPEYATPAIYIRTVTYDELAPGETRCFRR